MALFDRYRDLLDAGTEKLSQGFSNLRGNVKVLTSQKTAGDWVRPITQPIYKNVIKPTAQAAYRSTVAYGASNPLLSEQDRKQALEPLVKSGSVSPESATGNLKFQLTPQGFGEAGRTLATGIGLDKLSMGGAGITGLLGGGINKLTGGDFYEGATKALGNYPALTGVASGTNPLFSKYLSKLSPDKATLLSDRIAPAISNVTQGIGMDAATGQKTSIGSVALDAVTGAFGGKGEFLDTLSNSRAYKDLLKKGEALGIKGVSPRVNRVHPEDLDIMREFADSILRGGKDKKPLGELGVAAQRLAEHYLGGDWKTASNKKLAQAFEWAIDLNMNIPRESRGQLPSANLVNDAGESVISGLRKLDFQEPYKRGDITILQKRLDELLGTASFNTTGKRNATLPARETAKKQLEEYAKNGDVDAQIYLREVSDLENQIANAQLSKFGEIQSKIGKFNTPSAQTRNLELDRNQSSNAIIEATPKLKQKTAIASENDSYIPRSKLTGLQLSTPNSKLQHWASDRPIPMSQKQLIQAGVSVDQLPQSKTSVSQQDFSGGNSSRLQIDLPSGQKQSVRIKSDPEQLLRNGKNQVGQTNIGVPKQVVKSNTEALKVSSSNTSITPEITKEIQGVEKALNTKVNLIDWFRTPDRVLKKIGLEKEAVLLKKQYNSYLDQLPKEINTVNKWYERVKQNTGAEKRIFKYLDGQKQLLSGTELQVAKEIQSYLKDWAIKLDLPEDSRIASYITHIFEDDFIQKEFDDDLAKILSDRIPGSVYDPFLQERLGKQGYIEDAFRALDAYIKRATRKYNMDPALEKIQGAENRLDLDSWKYVKYLTDRINMQPTDIDNFLDNTIKQSPIGYKLGQRPTAAISRNIRQGVYRATLGLNVGSALKNLTQGANTYAELGEKYTAIGYIKMLKNFKSGELEEVGVLRNDMIQDRKTSVKKAAWERLDKNLFRLFEIAEKINRGAAYYGGKSKALAQGMTEKQAIEAGKAVAEKTQFTFGSVDTPAALQSDIVKLFSQYQSYNVKQAEFLGEKIAKKDIAGLLRYMGAWSVFIYGAGDVLGLNPMSAIPWGSDIQQGESKIGQTPATQLVGGFAKALLKSPDKYGNEPADSLVGRLKQQKVPDALGATIIPAYSQGKKTHQGIKAFNRGYSETDSGRLRYPIEKTQSNQIKTGLFGQYSTKEAREYFDKNKRPLSDQQTEIYKSLPEDQGKEYLKMLEQERQINSIFDKLDKNEISSKEAESLIGKVSASEVSSLLVDSNNKLLREKMISFTKKKIKAGLPVTEQELVNAYLDSSVNLPNKTKYQKSIRDSELYSDFNRIESDENLSEAQRVVLTKKLAEELGETPENLKLYSIVKQSNDHKTQYTLDGLQNKSPVQKAKFILEGRKVINGKMIVSDGVVDNMVEDGLISKDQGKYIKSLEWNEQTKQVEAKVSKKSGRKKKIKITPVSIKIPKSTSSSVLFKPIKPKKQKKLYRLQSLT